MEGLTALLALLHDPAVAAVAEYRCTRGHAHLTGLPLVEGSSEATGRLRALRFAEVRCPICETEIDGWFPPSRIRAIWWEAPPEDRLAARACETFPAPPGGWMP